MDQRLKPRLYTFTKGDELSRLARLDWAHRPIVNVTFRCVPPVLRQRNVRFVDSLDEVLFGARFSRCRNSGWSRYLWRFLVYQRRVVPKSNGVAGKTDQNVVLSGLQLASIDVGATSGLKLVVALHGSGCSGSRLVRLFMRVGVPWRCGK